jgi:hypothetical protein
MGEKVTASNEHLCSLTTPVRNDRSGARVAAMSATIHRLGNRRNMATGEDAVRVSGKTDPYVSGVIRIGAAVAWPRVAFVWIGMVLCLIVQLMVDGRRHQNRCGPGVGRCGRSSLDV